MSRRGMEAGPKESPHPPSLARWQTSLEPGDRFELREDGVGKRFRLPVFFQAQASSIGSLEDDQGRPLEFSLPGEGLWLAGPGVERVLSEKEEAVWLVSLGGNRFRLEVETRQPLAEIKTEQGLRVQVDEGWRSWLRPAEGAPANWESFALARKAARLATHAGFDQLICLPLVRDMELLEHQIRTAKTVLQRFRGRALLCDEVGLGKTIEAGLIMSELSLRGLARSILVLTPPSLIEQWQGEMRRKFGLELISHDAPEFRERGKDAWGTFDRIIASTHTAKREPHRSAIAARKWDLVVVDEAHHLRNRTTQLWRFASEIEKQYILLLTATPVQNNLEELFNLVTLLEPGLLRTAKQFQKQFVDRRDKLLPRNVDELHRLLGEVMVRNRRSTVGLQFTRRWARTERVPLSAGEQALYTASGEFVQKQWRRDKGPGVVGRMALLSLQMALGSSSRAAAGVLETLSRQPDLSAADRQELLDLQTRSRGQVEQAKVQRLLSLVDEFQDKMVIFTQFRATQEMLAERLTQAGHAVSVFHGGLTRLQKEEAVRQFRGPARLLLATEAGSEGRNLQFAHAICNFDLPWNPMKIEQRIGRLSRIGQTHDVHVFNLVGAGTIEAAVLHLLEAKLNMFELVIGEVDMILGNLGEEEEFQDIVASLWADAADGTDFSRRMEDLGNRLVAAKEAYFHQKGVEEKLFADRFAPDR